MTLADLRRAARDALSDHEALRDKLGKDGAYGHLPLAQRERLLGLAPGWAAYVESLGEPASPVIVSEQQAIGALGSVSNIRAYALRLLEVADALREKGF